MKHLFTVHSPITFLCAYGVIQKEQIPEEKVIILASGYKVPFEIGRVVPAFQDTQRSIWSKIVNWNVPNAYDQYISYLTKGECFIAYIDLMHAYQRILVTHPNCKQFHFIEEGTASYVLGTTFETLSYMAADSEFRHKNTSSFFKSLMRVLRGHSLRVLSLPYQAHAYAHFNNIKFYTFSEFCYPGVAKEKKSVVRFDSADQGIGKMTNGLQINHAVIWVEESYPQVYGVEKADYEQALVKSVTYLQELYPSYKHYVKLRPKQLKETSAMLKVLHKQGQKHTILNEDIMIEPLLIQSTACITIGCVSSVLFYASIYGHTALSFYDLIVKKPRSIFDDLGVYWKNVDRISKEQ
ncbi:MAG: hypothetical protein CV087_16910 [Candidatus Brocadia sp. WS118]|nr:MAG: hypothetical protein CV087_16910 [Candidatus Brocadia sp. WS118]